MPWFHHVKRQAEDPVGQQPMIRPAPSSRLRRRAQGAVTCVESPTPLFDESVVVAASMMSPASTTWPSWWSQSRKRVVSASKNANL